MTVTEAAVNGGRTRQQRARKADGRSLLEQAAAESKLAEKTEGRIVVLTAKRDAHLRRAIDLGERWLAEQKRT